MGASLFVVPTDDTRTKTEKTLSASQSAGDFAAVDLRDRRQAVEEKTSRDRYRAALVAQRRREAKARAVAALERKQKLERERARQLKLERRRAETARKRRAAAKSEPAPAKKTYAEPAPGVWDRLAQCESGGDWSINTGNGFYGGLQFTLSSWRAVGGSGMPNHASRAEQIMRGQRLQAMQGWGAWPVCSRKIGVR